MIQHGTLYGILDDEFAQPIEGSGTWTSAEHSRFLMAMKLHPQGPWKKIANIVRTRSIRQVQTHAQKYREKIARRQRGLKTKNIESQAQLHLWSPVPVASNKPFIIDMVNTTTNLHCENELPALPDCLDFLLDLMTAVDPIKMKGQ